MVTIGIDNQTGEIIFEENGNRIYDPSQITYIKRHSNWKEKVFELSSNLKETIDNNIETKRTIYKQIPKMLTENDIRSKVSNLNCNYYIMSSYTHKAESSIKSAAYDAARKYAECNASKSIFTRNKQINDLCNKKLPEFVDFFKSKDTDEEEKFYREEKKIKTQKDSEYKTQYENDKNDLLKYITDDEKQINNSVRNCVKEIDNIIVSNCFYKSFPSNSCTIFITLPDSSCIEQRIGNILASGKISIKQRKVNEIQDDWYLYCNGLILYIAGKVFNVNTCIKNIIILAEYSKLNTAFGSRQNVIFAKCEFNRSEFSKINFSNINPIDTIKAFSNNNITETQQVTSKNKIQKSKSPFEIECYSELSNNSLNIIVTGLKSLFSRYGESIFEEKAKSRLLSAIKDIFPKNEAEKQIVEMLINENCFSGFIDSASKSKAESNIKKILSANSLDENKFISNLDAII